jgi:hypothetical protein
VDSKKRIMSCPRIVIKSVHLLSKGDNLITSQSQQVSSRTEIDEQRIYTELGKEDNKVGMNKTGNDIISPIQAEPSFFCCVFH